MANSLTVFAALVATVLFFSVVGLALARRIAPGWACPAAIAPALGWASFSAVSLPLQIVVGFSVASTSALALAAVVAAIASLGPWRPAPNSAAAPLPVWTYALAGAVALLPLAALLPKAADGGVIIGSTAFDHSKIAMVDEITRLGLPAGNPFFGALGARSTLPYYYLWHVSAAQISSLGRISGWEAEAAMTGFTAYASLALMMGLAAQWGPHPEGRATRGRIGMAAAWVAAISLTGSLRPLLTLALGAGGLDGLLSRYTGLAGWMVQASWVPQHMASACCVVMAVMLLTDLAARPRPSVAFVLAAVAAAGVGSSIWVGGVTFAVLAAAAGIAGLGLARREHRAGFLAGAALAALIAAALALPLLQTEFGSLSSRQGGAPIGLHPYEVLGAWTPDPIRRLLDLPAFWLVLLPIELPAIFPVGLIALAARLRRKSPEPEPYVWACAILVVLSLATAWLLISTVGNNDLGWRAILPAVLVLTAAASATLSRWIASRTILKAAPAIVLVVASLPDHQVVQNLRGRHTDNAPDFAAAPQLWAAVRRHAGPEERVANNPGFLDDLTDWPVNPSWAMLSNRPSCYSGFETARAYVALPAARLTALDAQFARVFEGRGSPQDVRQMAVDYGCKVVVVVDSDGAWDRDPFAASAYYRLVETRPDHWRIYRAVAPRAGPP